MIINTEQAIKIIEGMPSDTAIWNWWVASNMIEAAEQSENIDDFVAALCELERTESEQMLAQESGEYFSELTKLEGDRLASLQQRVKTLIETIIY
jgi:hypothetical protein